MTASINRVAIFGVGARDLLFIRARDSSGDLKHLSYLCHYVVKANRKVSSYYASLHPQNQIVGTSILFAAT
jgi:hypothetical protein